VRRAGLLALAGLATLAACVRGRYRRVRVNEPVDREALAALRPGVDTLATCMRALGAPVRVVEHRVDAARVGGVALAYYWLDATAWGVTVSPPRARGLSYEFDATGTDLPGCVLWFDEALVLERAREGRVGDLLPRPRRPAPVLDEGAAAR
jgi:hypothetical protein